MPGKKLEKEEGNVEKEKEEKKNVQQRGEKAKGRYFTGVSRK